MFLQNQNIYIYIYILNDLFKQVFCFSFKFFFFKQLVKHPYFYKIQENCFYFLN